MRCSQGSLLLVVDLIDQCSNALDIYSHIISVAKNNSWVLYHANARTSSCEDDGASFECCSLRQKRDHLGNIENHLPTDRLDTSSRLQWNFIPRVRVLNHTRIVYCFDVQLMRIWHRFWRDQHRANRRRSIHSCNPSISCR